MEKDKRNKNSRKYVGVIVLLLLLLGVTIGYSALSTTLNISGTSTINSASWNIHFANVNVVDGSVTATTPITLDDNDQTITYGIALAQPGDFFEFTFNVKNDGSVPAELATVPTLAGVSTAQDVYTNYTITHADDSAIVAHESLAAGAQKSFKVRVEYDPLVNPEQLPTSAQNLTLTVAMNYVQA